jgi:hypothetical protein
MAWTLRETGARPGADPPSSMARVCALGRRRPMPHVGGHLRTAFAVWIENRFPPEVDLDHFGDHIFNDGKPRSIRWLMGQLWHCSDIMPWDVCEQLDMPRGSTYASAVQLLAKDRAPVG